MSGLNPHVETIEPWVSAGIRQLVPVAALHEVFPTAFEQVVAKVSQAGGTVVGPAYARYFGMPTDSVDVEIGFGIDRPIAGTDLTVHENPAVQAAIGTHVGPYELLEKSYAEVMPWLAEQHLKLADSMLEFYDSPPEVDPSQAVTRMVFPLA
jgi:effector-binding domain-containing protein